MKLKVTKLPDQNFAYTNYLAHNKDDFDGVRTIYLNIDQTVVKSKHHKRVESGYIGVGLLVRQKFRFAFDDEIDVLIHELKNESVVSRMRLSVVPYTKARNLITFHEDDFVEYFRKGLAKHYFSNDQILIFSYKGYNYTVTVNCREEGFISGKTAVTVVPTDLRINMVTSKLLKRELFSDDFSFEEIGVGGMDKELITIFRRALSSRGVKPSIVKKLGIKHVKGILLYGPPGTGKTLTAMKIGNLISNKPPKIVNGPEILNKFVGESEKNMRDLFAGAIADTSNSELHVIIFDEIDAICKSRGSAGSGTRGALSDSLVNQLLTMISGTKALNNIFVIAMTNRKDLLDPALLRAGRIEVHIEIGLPNREGREQIFRIHTSTARNTTMFSKDVSIEKLAELTDNYSGAEIEAVVTNACSRALYSVLKSDMASIDDNDIVVTMDDFYQAIDEVEPAFGRSSKTITTLVPKDYQMNSQLKSDFQEYAKTDDRINTLIVFGETKSGKTTTSCDYALNSKIKYTRLVRPIDFVNMDVGQKLSYLTNIFFDAYLSNESLIVIDDLEILIEYVMMGSSVTFSNRMYQTILTLLKSPPKDPTHKIWLIVTCGNRSLFDQVVEHFDKQIFI